MPVKLIPLETGVLLKGSGVVTFAEIQKVNEQLYFSSEESDSIAFQICDFRDLADLNVSSSEVRILSEQDRAGAEKNPEMLIAVVGNNELTFGMLRMWEQVFSLSSNEERVSAFRTVEDAQKWIHERKKSP